MSIATCRQSEVATSRLVLYAVKGALRGDISASAMQLQRSCWKGSELEGLPCDLPARYAEKSVLAGGASAECEMSSCQGRHRKSDGISNKEQPV